MGARWEVALPWTMVSAARWENRVRAATRAEASAREEQQPSTLLLWNRPQWCLSCLASPHRLQYPSSRWEGTGPRSRSWKAASQEPPPGLCDPWPEGLISGTRLGLPGEAPVVGNRPESRRRQWPVGPGHHRWRPLPCPGRPQLHSPALEIRYWAWPFSRALTASRAAWALLTR